MITSKFVTFQEGWQTCNNIVLPIPAPAWENWWFGENNRIWVFGQDNFKLLKINLIIVTYYMGEMRS
jgi:hypothetical protein